MTGRSWGAALTSGLAAGAVGLVCLLGVVVLRSTAVATPNAGTVTLQDAQNPPRSTPTRSREGADKPGRKDQPPPVRLWRGPTPEKHPPRARKALA